MDNKTCGHCTHSMPLEDAGWPKQGDLMECAVNGFLSESGAMISPDWVLPSNSCEKFQREGLGGMSLPIPGTVGVDEDGIEFRWSEPMSIGLGFPKRPVREYAGDALKRFMEVDMKRYEGCGG